MNRLLIFSILIFLSACEQTNQSISNKNYDHMEIYDIFDKTNHLQPEFDKTRYDTLHGWDFGWAVLEPINVANSRDDEKELSKRFSLGQKALYFFWYLDAEVTNGGFIQFYWNDYRPYLPTIREGLKLIGDNELLNLLDKADQEYLTHKDKFDKQREKQDWTPLYNDLKKFEEYDRTYYKIHDRTMELIEQYARLHPDEFVKLK
jgi:hypothetical protein